MEIARERYLQKLLDRKENGLVKVITGIRRCGKSYLLFHLYKNRLLGLGIPADHIITMALDDIVNIKYRNAVQLYHYVTSHILDDAVHYVFLDEIQFLESNFVDLVNGLMHIENLDIYVTGSNSRFLSSDILTEFRGRGDEIRVFPLSFCEFATAYDNINTAWKDYYTYGGLPLILSRKSDELKAEYLISLFQNIYINDIKERNNIRTDDELDILIDIIASAVGSLTNPTKLSNSFRSMSQKTLSDKTIKLYLDYLADAFLIEKAVRFNVKGKKYIDSPAKYYFEDVGLRNARLNFRQQEENHIMENIIYTELRSRGYRVDVGVIETQESAAGGMQKRKQLEIDFIANKGNRKYYIQSAFALSTPEKMAQEKKSLNKLNDSFRKFIIVKDDIKAQYDENGLITMGIFDFLLHENSLDL
ncbi:MAG: ATP-binding protein [Bacteroidales bacterium]|nr:ATP-binding protein [Bacteroidales bacterium]MCM1415325.1 ATP-binding protein [bacterium]MCM1424555.1 ATP-binding protein [bacterium]